MCRCTVSRQCCRCSSSSSATHMVGAISIGSPDKPTASRNHPCGQPHLAGNHKAPWQRPRRSRVSAVSNSCCRRRPGPSYATTEVPSRCGHRRSWRRSQSRTLLRRVRTKIQCLRTRRPSIAVASYAMPAQRWQAVHPSTCSRGAPRTCRSDGPVTRCGG